MRSITSDSTTNDCVGSKRRTSFTAATSSAPSAEPCTFPLFCLPGDGHPMIVRSTMSDGWSVTALAATIAAFSSWRSSWYAPVFFQSTTCVCQWYASYLARTSSLNAMLVSPSIEIWLLS